MAGLLPIKGPDANAQDVEAQDGNAKAQQSQTAAAEDGLPRARAVPAPLTDDAPCRPPSSWSPDSEAKRADAIRASFKRPRS